MPGTTNVISPRSLGKNSWAPTHRTGWLRVAEVRNDFLESCGFSQLVKWKSCWASFSRNPLDMCKDKKGHFP